MVTLGGNVVKIIISATDQASAVVDGVKGKLGGLGGAMDKLRGPMLAVGAASVGMAAVSVKSFADYESAMANVTTLMGEGENAMDTFGDAVKRISTELPVQGGHLSVAAGLYQTISAGITDTAEAMQFLEIATKASIGGSAELETVILAGTKAMAAFGLEVEDTERIMDVFAATVKAGQTTMPELAAAFPRVAGAAGEMGMTLEETAGILAGLTKILPSTDEAATSLNAVLIGLLKPSDAMKDALKDLGFESGQAAIKQQGLMKTLQDLKGYVDGDAEAMGELFGNVRALRAVFPALGTAAEDIADSLEIVGDSAGLMQDQFETMESTTGARMTNLQNKFGELTIRIGEALLPVLEMLVPVVEKVVEVFSALDPVIQAAIVVGGMLMGAFALLWPVISGVAGAIGGAGGLSAVIAALTGPIGWIILAVGLLAAAWATNFGGIRDIAEDVFETVSPIFDKIMGLLGRIAEILIDVFGPAFEAIFGFVSDIIYAAWETVFRPVFEWIMEYVGLVIDTFDALLSALQGDLGPLQNILGRWQQFFINTFYAIINGAWNFVTGLWNTISQGIRNIGSWLYNAGRDLIWSIIRGLQSIGWKIWNTIMGFIPSMSDISDAVWGAVESAGSWVGQQVSNVWPDFIARPGMGIQAFSPDDTIIGVKDVSALAGIGGGGTARTTTIFIENVNVASDYDVEDFKRKLAEDEKDAWANKQNK